MTAKARMAAKKRPYRKRRKRKTPKRYGICLDSLHQIQPGDVYTGDGYELVIID